MTKLKNIWLWIFIAMFAIPEILWSPVSNFLYMFWKGGNIPFILRDNFLMHSDYRKLAIAIIFLQCFGALLSLIVIYKTSIKFIFKFLLSVLFFIFLVLSLFVLFVLISTVNISLVM